MAALGVLPEPKKLDRRRTSCETLCSSNSSCALQKRKPLHPLAASVRSRTSNNPVSQRVLSAKLLRFKQLQNQLTDANYHIAQLVNENKLLKNLQKRQDNALSKYEGANAHLPQVLESHQEEIRILQERNKNLRKNVKDLKDMLKTREDELLAIKDQNKHLMSLCKNKNLEEREKLNDKVEELNDKVRQNETTITNLNRKIMVESKNYKFKLNSEITKHKDTQKELQRALMQIAEMQAFIEGKGQPLESSRSRRSIDRKPQSVINLNSTQPNSIKKPLGGKKGQKMTGSLSNLCIDEPIPSNLPSKTSPQNANVNKVLTNEFRISQTHTPNSEDRSNSSKSQASSSKSPLEDIDSSSEAQIKEIVNSWQKKNLKREEIQEEMMKYATNEKVEKKISNLKKKAKKEELDEEREEREKTLKEDKRKGKYSDEDVEKIKNWKRITKTDEQDEDYEKEKTPKDKRQSKYSDEDVEKKFNNRKNIKKQDPEESEDDAEREMTPKVGIKYERNGKYSDGDSEKKRNNWRSIRKEEQQEDSEEDVEKKINNWCKKNAKREEREEIQDEMTYLSSRVSSGQYSDEEMERISRRKNAKKEERKEVPEEMKRYMSDLISSGKYSDEDMERKLNDWRKSTKQEESSSDEEQNDRFAQDIVDRNMNIRQTQNKKKEAQLHEKMDKYASGVISSAHNSRDSIDKHTLDYEKAIEDNTKLLEVLKENDMMNQKLNKMQLQKEKMSFYDYKIISQKNENTQMVTQFLKSERNCSFEADLLENATNSEVKTPEVDQEDRRKLLATLKAIDNGDSVDLECNDCTNTRTKQDLMKELFG